MNMRNAGMAVSLAVATMLVVGCNKKEEPLPVGPKVVAPVSESSNKPGKWSDEKWKQYCKDHKYTDATCGNALHRQAIETGVAGITSGEHLKKLNDAWK